MKSLLVLSGGRESISGVITAKNKGYKVIVADGNIDAPCKKYSDDFIHVNIYDHKETLRAVKKYQNNNSINGVISIATDNPICVAVVADELGLSGLSQETARISSNKLLMKDKFKSALISNPGYFEVRSQDQLKHILKSKPGEYVLKPIDSRGSRGVVRISNINDVSYVWNYSKKYTNSDKLILEEWLDGPQLSSESLVWNSKAYLCGLADRTYDKLDDLYPFVVENGGETPSVYSPQINDSINNIMTKAANAIGLKNGSIKGDIVLTEKGPFIIEVAARLSGGYFSTDIIPRVYKYNIVEQLISIALGEKPVLPPNPLINYKYQVNRFLFLPLGLITSINQNLIHSKDLIFNDIYVKPGEIVKRIDSHVKRNGMALAISHSRKKALNICNKAIKEMVVNQEV
jgi:biotin carboxylase